LLLRPWLLLRLRHQRRGEFLGNGEEVFHALAVELFVTLATLGGVDTCSFNP
jgi:uncharacterized membrane protein YjgN (DUF898 family)